MNAEKRANTAILQANSEKEKAERKASEYNNLIASQKKLTEKRAEELNDKFRTKWQWIIFILIAYSGLVTLFTGYKSERVKTDCTNAINMVANTFTDIVDVINSISEQITSAVGIPETIVVIFMTIVVFGIIGVIIFLVGRIIVNVYREYCYDEISLLVLLASIAILVWFAEFMPLNIVLLLILSHILYIVVRWCKKI